ncbi:MAG: Glu/Leu/Phe/Val dehydrogenase [Planctomycetota bacterium]
MPSIDFDEVSQYVQLPGEARVLLERPERELRITMSLRLDQALMQCDVYVVYYNTARGPAKGGIRFWPTVTMDHTVELSEKMVWKTALVGVPFGGGKSGVRLDAGDYTRMQKTAILKEFVHVIRPELMSGSYVPAPDMGTNAYDMAVIFGETHLMESVTGKPPRVGGLPGRLEATGRGLGTCIAAAARRHLESELAGLTVAVQGYGNVGSWCAHFIDKLGATVVAASDISGGVYAGDGLDVRALAEWCGQGKMLADYPDYDPISNAELLAADVDILVPAAAEDALTGENAEAVSARLIVEGANGPTTPEADAIFNRRGTPVVPDILANSGGVIASYIEWRKAKSGSLTSRDETFETVDRLVLDGFRRVSEFAEGNGITPRVAARCLSVQEVVATMSDRGWI